MGSECREFAGTVEPDVPSGPYCLQAIMNRVRSSGSRSESDVASRCKVKVHFQKIIDDFNSDNSGSVTVVPNSEFTIGRTAFGDNTSFYEMNDKRCQFKIVCQRLKKEGIDLDNNRYLILQGEVEQIALLKPKAQREGEYGMLEYLEELIGSSRYKKPIAQFEQRLAEYDIIRSEKLNRVKLVEKEVNDLVKPRNEALDYLKLAHDIAEKKNIGYQQYIFEYKVLLIYVIQLDNKTVKLMSKNKLN